MMKYIVLRDAQRTRWPGPSSSGTRTFGDARSWPDPPEPRIEVETADARGRSELAGDPGTTALALAMPTRLIEPFAATGPHATGDAWGIGAVGAAASAYTGSGVTAAVLDTGIDPGHSAFAGLTVLEEDFTRSGNGDRHGHGTHCAGTIAGRDVGGCRIGVARGISRLLAGKILTDTGTGSSEMAFQGLQWAASQGAQVVSMSFGFDFPGMVRDHVQQGWPTDLATSIALEAYRGNLNMFDTLMAMLKAQEPFRPGCVVVAAAGNESRRDIRPDYQIAASLPSAADGILSIAAVAQSAGGYTIAAFSNTFPQLCAPGVDITSAQAGGTLTTMSGTSMACPQAAGIAALWWQAVRETGLPATAQTVTARILAACRLDTLAPNLDIADRGNGIATAP
jgi:subtilisin family serine protease